MGPLRVLVRRGDVVEAVHRVDAVAVRAGAVVAEAGDGGRVAFMRSSAKPLQALPVVRARPDLDERDLAIAAASHRADAAQLDAAAALLAKVPAREDELECGAEGRPPRRLNHNCSGKHAGMLALCRARGWPSTGYRLEGHPVQQACLDEVAHAADVPATDIPTAVDGCGVVTFALPLERMAFAFSRLEAQDGGAQVAAAMRAHPELVGGGETPDTRLMQELPGWIAKVGAEGLVCAAGPDGTGLALKAEDGAVRALGPALASFLALLDVRADGLGRAPLLNSRGERVGELVTEV